MTPRSPSRARLLGSALARLLAGALTLLFAPDCTGDLPDDDTSESTATATAPESGVVLSAAIWSLAWDDEGVTFPATGGFEVDTDLGYHVHVAEGRLVSHSVSFGACGATAESSRIPSFFGLPIKSAHAHSGNTEPSFIETSLVEDLVLSDGAEAASSFPPVRYCRAHWLLAQPEHATSGPDDIPMDARSLYVSGTVRRARSLWRFTIDTWWPEGRLADLETATLGDTYTQAQRDDEVHHAFVTVTRHRGHLFDGIDFETASSAQITAAVIDNLVAGADVQIELWSPGSSD